MKRKILFSLLILVVANHGYSQTYLIAARAKHADVWSYFDKNGKAVITLNREPGDNVNAFSEDGVAILGLSSFKLINTKGEIIKTKIAVKHFRRDFFPIPFSDGLLIVGERGRYGCIDTLGQLKIPFKYDDITPFNQGHATARTNQSFFVLDKRGNEIAIRDTSIVDVEQFQENLASFQSRSDKAGFIGTNGEVIIPAQFKAAGFFSDGLAWARDTSNNLTGFIDTLGRWVIAPQFSAVKPFDAESGLARVKTKGDNSPGAEGMAWRYINKQGQIQTFNTPLRIEDFSEGLALCPSGNTYGFIDNKGRWAIAPQFDEAHHFKNGYACVKQKKLWGVIDKKGNWLLEPQFEAIRGDLVKIRK